MQLVPLWSESSRTYHLCWTYTDISWKDICRWELVSSCGCTPIKKFPGALYLLQKICEGTFKYCSTSLHVDLCQAKVLMDRRSDITFKHLKQALTSAPILTYPQTDKQFLLDTDASNESVRVVFSQETNGQVNSLSSPTRETVSQNRRKLLYH